jgi:hypothetical protein
LEPLVDDIIESGGLKIQENVRFIIREGHLKCRLPVHHPENIDLSGMRLEIVKSVDLPSFSIVLLLNSRRVRCYCSDEPHTNPQDYETEPGRSFTGYHKHRWSDATGDECVYIPSDIPGSPLEEAFYQFCDECGITFGGVWNDPPPAQLPLLGV